jgi:hypothetical protein
MPWCLAPDFTFSFLLPENCFARLGAPLICSAICQWSELQRTRIHTLLSHLRLPGSLSIASYDSQGLRWKYYYPPPHGEGKHVFWSGFIKAPVVWLVLSSIHDILYYVPFLVLGSMLLCTRGIAARLIHCMRIKIVQSSEAFMWL